MRTKIMCELKKIISILVCVMMVLVTCPVNMLSSAVFAPDEVQTQAIPDGAELLDEGQEISLEGGGGASRVEVSDLDGLKNAIKQANPRGNEPTIIALTAKIGTSNRTFFSSPAYSLECEGKSIIITSANPSSPQTINIGSTKSGLLRAKKSDVILKNINITGISTKDQKYGCAEDKHIRSAICVEEGGSITIGEGVNFSEYSKIDSEGSSDRLQGDFIWCHEGTVNIEGGEVSYCGSKNSTGSVVYCSGGTVNIKGGSFHNCRADRGIIFSNGATVSITGGTFNKCCARLGSVVMASGGSVAISGGNFKECSGSAITLIGASLNMTSGNFVNCFSAYGGAVDVSSGSCFTMTGGKISGCSGSRGGAICVEKNAAGLADPSSKGSTFIMQGGEISDCRATEEGGAIYVDEGCTVMLKEGTITGCSACGTFEIGHGSAIYVCYTSQFYIAKKESGLFKIQQIGQGDDTSSGSCAGYSGIYLAERPEDSKSGYQYTEVKEIDPLSQENNNSSNGGSKSNLLGADGSSDSGSETGASENSVENTQSEANEASTYNDKDQSSDNDLSDNSYLKAFLDGDTDSKIVQIDKDSGIVLTAEDKIIPPGYHLFVESIQKDSDKWKARTKDMDEKHLNDVEKMGMYDISIRNSNGDIFALPTDPPVTVTVFIPCPNGYDVNDLQILHISSGVDGEFDEEVTTVDGKKYCKFKTNHFSPYAIIDEFSKGDVFEMIAPWLIGAAVVAIGAVAVVVVLKNKNKAGA